MFPSPSRGSYFSIVSYGRLGLVPIQFPSPSRGSYFSIVSYGRLGLVPIQFPSPSRGSYFSITTKPSTKMATPCFRPLPGDLISQWVNIFKTANKEVEFPSPSRGSYFSIGQKILEYDMTHNVSVPFPGILFLNNSSTDKKEG